MKNSRMFCIVLLKLNSVRALISALFWTPSSDFASNTHSYWNIQMGHTTARVIDSSSPEATQR